ncbi:uncharacterized protein FFB20_15919 [Fusarium fujikuroi]|nr:uncharacterized protein FFB20_15919 [Fusarium fujikuroi]
MTALYLGEL